MVYDAGAFTSPNGILLKLKFPIGVVKDVLCLDFGSRGICQNPLDISNIEKYLGWASPSESNKDSSLGNACKIGLVTLFRRR